MTKEEAITILSDIRSEYNCFSHIEGGRYHALCMGIEALKERKSGKWEEVADPDDIYVECECSECNKRFNKVFGGKPLQWKPYNFCPNCGARMDGES